VSTTAAGTSTHMLYITLNQDMASQMMAVRALRSTGEPTWRLTRVRTAKQPSDVLCCCLSQSGLISCFLTQTLTCDSQTRLSAPQDLYQLLYQLTTVTGQPRYAAAADAALTFFLASTVAPESGLLPWGAHAQWDFRRDTWARGASLAHCM